MHANRLGTAASTTRTRAAAPSAAALLLALCAAFTAACAEPSIGGFVEPGGPCNFDADCAEGLTCQMGTCQLPGAVTRDGGLTLPDAGQSDGGAPVDGGADAGTADAGFDAGIGNGFGAPCRANADCKSGICIQSTSQGSVCSKFCSEDCPVDWGCKVVQIGPMRTAAVCYPGADLYCIGCNSDNCASAGDRCTQIGAARYCTRDCTATGVCPSSFECVEVALGPDGGAVAPPGADGGAPAIDGGSAAPTDGGLPNDAGAPAVDAGAPAADGGGTGSGVRQCVPITRLCPGCIDADGDGYGVGADCLGTDCNDNNRAIHPAATELCNGTDDNCNTEVDEVFDLSSDAQNCGACNIRCDTAQGFTCCNGACVRPSSDPLNCGGCGDTLTGDNICNAGETCCGGSCTNTDTSIAHCGACSTQPRPRACLSDGSQLCCAGTCRDIRNDDANCGGCAVPATGQNVCRVVFGERCCAGNCKNVLSDSTNCGGCGGSPRQCTAGTESCCNGACTSVIDNDLACGACGNNCTIVPGGNCCGAACYNKLSDAEHCGDSCIACGGASPACCNGGCSDLQIDTTNCGSCGRACGTGESCCGGACRDLREDENNCGACGRRCGAGQTCCDGQCRNLATDPNNCGTTCATRRTCTAPFATCCGGSCTNTQTDDANCGACGGTCSVGSGGRCCSGVCKNIRNGDATNCGACGAICNLSNVSSHTCSNSLCQVAACTGGWSNVDNVASNGCECSHGDHEPNNTSGQSVYLGNLPDSGATATARTRIVPWSSAEGFDVEWFRFGATDDFLGDFSVRVTLSGLPGNNYRLTVYRGAPPGSNSSYSCGFLCFESCRYPASKTANSNGAGSVSISMDEGSICDDDGGTFYVSIEQLSGSPACVDFTLTARNG